MKNQKKQKKVIESRKDESVTVTKTVDPNLVEHLSTKRQRISAFQEGKRFGPYRLIRILGQGGYGQVWEAENLESGRRVALKVLTEVQAASPEAIQRFQREGKLAASLSHPNCVYVFGVEEIDGYHAVSMELMPGGTLKDLIKDGPLPYQKAVDFILDIIDGLNAAHKSGILHRDVKPSNCFLDEAGNAKIGDFGISKTLEVKSDLSITGTFLGTPFYSSPEQIRGRDVDFRSDFYSLGATLYELITGKSPFEGENASQVMARILSEEPTPFSHHDVRVPKGLQRVVLRLLSKEREKRNPNYDSLRTALSPFSSQSLTSGSMAKRFAAIVMDLLILSVINITLASRMLVTSSTRTILFITGIQTLCIFLYFFLLEMRWGRSLGKFLLGLRVAKRDELDVTFSQILLRTVIFVFFANGPSILIGLLTIHTDFVQAGSVTMTLFPFVGYLILLSTIRQKNGYAGIHELASRTRVIALPKTKMITVPEHVLSEARLSKTEGRNFGPYLEVSKIWETGREAFLVAYDEVLDREVWIHSFHEDIQAPPVSHLTATRSGRLNWLQGSRRAESKWDAYGIPSGISLYHWVTKEGRLSWEEMRRILLSISRELEVRFKDGHLPELLSLKHIWIDSLGRAKLIDFPIRNAEAEQIHPVEVTPEKWQDFMYQIVLFGFERKYVAVENLDNEIPHVPLPEYARPLVDRICGRGNGFESITSLVSALEEMAARPAKVTKGKRLGPLAIKAAFPLMVFFGMLLGVLMLSQAPDWLMDAVSTSRYIETLKELEKEGDIEEATLKKEAIRKVLAYSYSKTKSSPQMKQLLSGFEDEQIAYLESALEDYPHLTEHEVSEARQNLSDLGAYQQPFSKYSFFSILSLGLISGLSFLVFLSIPAVIFAFILRGGVLFRMFGISIQTVDGKMASRFRCLWRAIVAWSLFPLVLLLQTEVMKDPKNPVFMFISLLFVVGAAVYSVVKPERGIQDIIAGTFLVPR